MKLEMWSHIRNTIIEQLNEISRDLDEMEASTNNYDELIISPKYKDAEKLWLKYEYIRDHMAFNITNNEILEIDY